MYGLLVTLAVGIIIFYLIYRGENNPSKQDLIGILAGTIVITAICYGIVLGIARMAYKEKNYEYKYDYLEIVSLVNKEASSMYGAFFLGCGSIHGETTDYYVTYGEFDRGLKRVKLDAYDVYLEETDDIAPRIENYFFYRISPAYKSKWIWSKEEEIRNGDWYEREEPMKIYVPENTIYKEFNIKD